METTTDALIVPMTTTLSVSMNDMLVLQKSTDFTGDEASQKRWDFVTRSFSAAVSSELRVMRGKKKQKRTERLLT